MAFDFKKINIDESFLSFNKIISFFNYCLNVLNGIYIIISEYLWSFFSFIYSIKLYIILFLITLITYQLIKFFWNYRKGLSKFLLFPQPLVRGLWFNIFQNFYKNSLTESLMELEKLLSSLPKNISVIIILGTEDNLEEITTFNSNEDMSWYFIRTSIYIYIKNKTNIQYIIGFLNRVRNLKPINSIIIKHELTDDFNFAEHLKDIRNISGIKTPIYLQIHNIKWLKNISFLLHKEKYLGFLFEEYDLISEANTRIYFENFRKFLLNKILLQKEFFPNFWIEFEESINILIEKLFYLHKLQYNILRGIFFTTDIEKVPLNNMLRIDTEFKTFFLSFHKYVIEKELLIGEPLDINLLAIPRYEKYNSSIFGFSITILFLYFIRMNNQMWLFKKNYQEYIIGSMNIMDNNRNNKTTYSLYEMLKKLENINLSSIYYSFLPHNYLVNYLYENFCQVEELITFNLINNQAEQKDINTDNNLDQLTEFEVLENYVKKITDLESVLFNNKKIKRFGIYKERSKKARENGKIAFEKSFSQIRQMYYSLLKNFLSNYFSNKLRMELEELQKDLLACLKNPNINSEDIIKLVKKYYHLSDLLKIHNSNFKIKKLFGFFAKIEKSIIFGTEIAIDTTNQVSKMFKEYEMSLMSVSNSITGPLLYIEKNQLLLSEKITLIIKDLENFLQEPFMDKDNSIGPILPENGLISSWNLNLLKDAMETENKANNFQKNIGKYSIELRPMFLLLFKKKIASSIFSKIGMSQQIVPKEYLNLQNTLDAFTYINILLQFFLNTGNTDYYYKLLEIFLHDFNIIDEYTSILLENTIFFQYKKMENLKQDNILDFIFATDKIEKIKEILNNDIDKFIKVYHQYMEPVLKILNYDHFINYRGTQYVKYRSISLDIQRFEKGINNSMNKFQDFVLNKLSSYSIYNCYKENTLGLEEETDSYLDGLLNNLKRNILDQSKKIYNNELILSYNNLRDEMLIFINQFPFNRTFNENNIISIHDLYTFLQKHIKTINLFAYKNILSPKLNEVMKKISGLHKNIQHDQIGYYIEPSINYNLPDSHSLHSKYIGLVNISQSLEYPAYLLQSKVKLYFHLPIFIHVEIATNPNIKILNIESPYYVARTSAKGIYFQFTTIWHFLYFIYKHMEKTKENDIQIMLSIPVKVGNNLHHIKFNILLKDFIIFPKYLPNI